MLGWLAILSRYGLFKETIRVFLLALRKHKPGLYDNIKDELSLDYLQDNFDLTEKDKDKSEDHHSEEVGEPRVKIIFHRGAHQTQEENGGERH